MERRTNLYGEGKFEEIDALEKELLAENAKHKDWGMYRRNDEAY